jgi:hypothetical protein
LIAKDLPEEPNDSVDLVVSLLVRHPELSRVVIRPRFAAIAFFFVVKGKVDAGEASGFRRAVTSHLRALHALLRDAAPKIAVRVRADEELTFVEIERDARDISRDEIALIVALVAETFGERLVVNPPADESGDDEPGAREDAVGSALDAVRRGKQRKSLVGLREERRVLIYFGK